MRGTILLAGLVALAMLPPAATAGHMTNYRTNPVEHDDQGRSDEPDGLGTAVLGPTVRNCVAALPTGQGFDGRCSGSLEPLPGQLPQLAPGCTGDGPGGAPQRRLSGQCGLWTVGVGTFLGVNVVPPATVPPPVSERGMSGDRAPGAFTPTKSSTIRFLDLKIMSWYALNIGPQNQVELNRKLADLGALTGTSLPLTRSVVPGDTMLHWWYGQWTDRNGNGVIDHVTPRSAGPTQNEFAWLGNCMDFQQLRNAGSIAKGLCIEDGNPHLEPPGAPCADAASPDPCAGATVHVWVWPGNHHAYGYGFLGAGPGDYPGQQVVNWALFECFEYETCDGADEAAWGDPLLGPQDSRAPDAAGYDTTGEPADAVRRWYVGDGWPTTFYGDDGLLVTSVQVVGANCRPVAASVPWAGFDPADCTFTDVDRQLTVHPGAEALLVGDPEAPTSGAKAAARGAWLVVRDLQLG